MSKLFETALENGESGRERAALMQKYEMGRSNLLVAIILTAVNIGVSMLGVDIYLLFALFTPTHLVNLAMILCGKLPPEYYTELGIDGIMFYDDAVFYAMLAAAAAITLVFFVLWLMSRGGKVAWLIAATALMGVDTLMIFLLTGIDMAYIIDIGFHAWLLYIMISGIVSYYKYKKLPKAEGDILDAFAKGGADIGDWE